MEITRDNAQTLIPLIESRLRECTYFSLDLEFSGIDRDTEARDLEHRAMALQKLPADGYDKKRKIMETYTVMQIGISVFKLCADTSKEDSLFDTLLRATKTKDTVDDLSTFFTGRESDPENTIPMCTQVCDAWLKALRSPDITSGTGLLRVATSIESNARTAYKETCEERKRVEAFTRTGMILLRKEEFFARWCAVATIWLAFLNNPDKASLLDKRVGADNVCSCYRCDTFFAYLFPAAESPFENISLNTETVGTFLASNNMDFNQWIRKGLRFTTMSTYLKAREEAIGCIIQGGDLSKYSQVFGSDLVGLAPLSGPEFAYVQWAAQIDDTDEFSSTRMHVIHNAAATIRFARSGEASSPPYISSFVPLSMNRDHLLVLNGLGLTKRGGRYERLDALPSSEVPKAATEAAAAAAATNASCSGRVSISATDGGSALLFAIVAAASTTKKPMIVHNGYTDVMMLMRMLHGELPPTYAEFKTAARICFPTLFDTRVFSSIPAIQKLGNFKGPLEQTYKTLLALNETGFASADATGGTNSAVFMPWDARPVSGDDDTTGFVSSLSAHNAGYDAFITGCVFAMLSCALVSLRIAASTYKGVVAVHGALYSIALRNKVADVYLLRKGYPVYLLDVPGGFRTIEFVRSAMESVTDSKVSVSVFFVGANTYAVEVAEMPPGYDVRATMSTVCGLLSAKNKANASMLEIDLAARGAAVQALE